MPTTNDIAIDAKSSNATSLSLQRGKIVDGKDDYIVANDKQLSISKDNLVDKATNAVKQFVSILNNKNNYNGNNYTIRNEEKVMSCNHINNNNINVNKGIKTHMGENDKGTYDRSHTPPMLLRTGRGEGYKYGSPYSNFLPQTSNDRCAVTT